MNLLRAFTALDAERAAHRDLTLVAVTVIGLSRLVEPPAVWFVAIFLLGAVLIGTLQVLGDESARSESGATGVPIESLILPAVAAVACVGAIRLVPFGLWLAPALLVSGLLVQRCLALEARLGVSVTGLTIEDADERTSVLVTALLVGFLGFVGVAAMIPGGLVQPERAGPAGGPLPETALIGLVAGDALIAFLLGYRVAALRVSTVRDALWSATTYAAAIAIAAAAVRFMEIPRLMGPALLALTFYLWDAVHAASPSSRRDARWVWQTALLLLLGVAVVALNLMSRG